MDDACPRYLKIMVQYDLCDSSFLCVCLYRQKNIHVYIPDYMQLHVCDHFLAIQAPRHFCLSCSCFFAMAFLNPTERWCSHFDWECVVGCGGIQTLLICIHNERILCHLFGKLERDRPCIYIYMSSYKLKVSSYVDVERPSRWNIVHQDDSSDIWKGCFNHNYLPTFFVGNQAPDRSIGQSFWPELASSLEILTAAACRQTRRWAKLFSSQWRPMCCRTVDWEAVHLASGALGHGGKWSFVTTVVIDLTQNWLDLRYIQALLKAICCYPLMALDVYICLCLQGYNCYLCTWKQSRA